MSVHFSVDLVSLGGMHVSFRQGIMKSFVFVLQGHRIFLILYPFVKGRLLFSFALANMNALVLSGISDGLHITQNSRKGARSGNILGGLRHHIPPPKIRAI